MRKLLWLCPVLFGLTACASHSSRSATLVLKNSFWDHVNVEAVVTKDPNCSDSAGYIATHRFSMIQGQTREIHSPDAQDICWRHDRDPDHPQKGAWSGWSRATMFPGQKVETDL